MKNKKKPYKNQRCSGDNSVQPIGATQRAHGQSTESQNIIFLQTWGDCRLRRLIGTLGLAEKWPQKPKKLKSIPKTQKLKKYLKNPKSQKVFKNQKSLKVSQKT